MLSLKTIKDLFNLRSYNRDKKLAARYAGIKLTYEHYKKLLPKNTLYKAFMNSEHTKDEISFPGVPEIERCFETTHAILAHLKANDIIIDLNKPENKQAVHYLTSGIRQGATIHYKLEKIIAPYDQHEPIKKTLDSWRATLDELSKR